MTRAEIISKFREENTEITSRVVADSVLQSWCEAGDKEICALSRCIVDQDGTSFSAVSGTRYYDLTAQITKFYDIDEYPGGGVAFDGERLDKTTISKLDAEHSGWRAYSNGDPDFYYRRGKYLYFDRAPSTADTIKIYSVLISDDFDNDSKIPFNQLSHLEPFHTAVVLYLQKRAKMKLGKSGEESKALKEYADYVSWMKKEISGGKYDTITYIPKAGIYQPLK